MAAPLLIGLHSKRPRSGKSTVASFLRDQFDYQIKPFAGPLKGMVRQFLEDAGLNKEQIHYYMAEGKEAVLPGEWERPTTARYLMQTLGTEWGRELVGGNIWLKLWGSSIDGAKVVVDDVRFPNEAAEIKARGGQMWLIERDIHSSAQVLSHKSESGLGEDYAFDSVLHNRGTVAELQYAARYVLSWSE
jgi:hypothetical protein